MAAARDDAERVLQQRTVAHRFADRQRDIDGQIELSGRQRARHVLAVDGAARERRVRRVSCQAFDDRGQQQRFDRVGQADAEGLARVQRIEPAPFLQQLPQLREMVEQRRRHALARRRGAHAPAVAHEQRIAQLRAQAAYRVADRRRRQRQALRGVAQMPLAVDGLEHPQQVQIQLVGLVVNFAHPWRLAKITSFTLARTLRWRSPSRADGPLRIGSFLRCRLRDVARSGTFAAIGLGLPHC